VARTLHQQSAELSPSALLQRLSTMNAQLVTGIAADPAAPSAVVSECVSALRRLRFDRETRGNPA